MEKTSPERINEFVALYMEQKLSTHDISLLKRITPQAVNHILNLSPAYIPRKRVKKIHVATRGRGRPRKVQPITAQPGEVGE